MWQEKIGSPSKTDKSQKIRGGRNHLRSVTEELSIQ